MRQRVLLVAILACGSALSVASSPRAQQPPKPAVTVYKSPTCGCCKGWVEHMRAAGFDMTAIDVEDVAPVKKTNGVPSDITSCHTALVDGYVVEGHVPADVVQRLLKERPQVAGLSAPGMPVGSPGMEQPDGHRDPYSVVTFDKSGKQTVYERR